MGRDGRAVTDAPAAPAERQRRYDLRTRYPEIVLVAAFVISRGALYANGLRFDTSALRVDSWQLLDTSLLRNDLWSSVWHLQSQPPLFNLLSGLLLQLPTGVANGIMAVVWLVLGLIVALASFRLLIELSIPRVAALVIALVLVVLNPAYILYDNQYSYTYLTQALLVAGSLMLLRFLRDADTRRGVVAFSCFGAAVLVDSHYQILWLLLGIAVLAIIFRRHLRRIVLVALVPVLVVAMWYGKNVVMFGTVTTSSWIGMNLAKGTLDKAPRPELQRLVADGTLTHIALIRSFSSPEDYLTIIGPLPHTGVAALDELKKKSGYQNFNNLAYVKISDDYLHDDIAYIRAEPGAYARSAVVAAQLWVTPADQAFVGGSGTWRAIGPYAGVYDRFVDVQPEIDRLSAIIALDSNATIPGAELSYVLIAALALTVFGLPVVVWRRRRPDPAGAAFLGFLWVTVTYSFVVSSLLELGENDRFSVEVGPLAFISAAVVVCALCRAISRRAARPDADAALPGAP